jgi:hypothetical protein
VVWSVPTRSKEAAEMLSDHGYYLLFSEQTGICGPAPACPFSSIEQSGAARNGVPDHEDRTATGQCRTYCGFARKPGGFPETEWHLEYNEDEDALFCGRKSRCGSPPSSNKALPL